MQQREIILQTLALADAFGWAMTGFECYRFALKPVPTTSNERQATPSLRETVQMLDALVEAGVLMERDGHYVLHGREHLIDERLQTTHLIQGKHRKAARWARRMVRLPHVLAVFAYGSLATGHVKEGSDLDVYVVLTDGRIFTGRVLTSLFLEVFGVRRTAYKVQDQVCLNHFAVRDAMGFQQEFRNPFSAWLWARMFPLAAKDSSVVQEFYAANQWVEDFFPNLGRSKEYGVRSKDSLRADPPASTRRQGEAGRRYLRASASIAGDWIESRLGEMQLRKIERNPLTQAGTGRIVANEREMIFHPGLPEEKVLADFAARKRELGVAD